MIALVMIALVGAGRDRPIDLAATQRPPRRAIRNGDAAGSFALAIALLAATACTISHVGTATPQLRQTETAYTALRSLRDTLDITRARGLTQTPAGEPLPSADHRFLTARAAITQQVAAIDTSRLRPDDRTALATLSTTLATDLADDPGAREPSEAHASCGAADAVPALATGDTTAANTFRRHLYDCFGRAATHVVVGGDTADRLTILGLARRDN